MKRIFSLILLLALTASLSGCAIGESKLVEICRDYASLNSTADQKVFLKSYQSYLTADCMADLLGMQLGENQDAKITLLEYTHVLDSDEKQFVLFCYRVSTVGFSNDVCVRVKLTDDMSKIEEITKLVMFSFLM